jgi:hypothetical protein
MIAHVALLYGSVAAAIVATVLTPRRREDPPLPPWEVAKTLAPFALIALVESLMLRASGHLVAEWALPLLAALVATWCSRSPRVIRRVRILLAIVAVVLWCHGCILLARDHATWPMALSPGTHARAEWYTPLTGMRHLDRPGTAH